MVWWGGGGGGETDILGASILDVDDFLGEHIL